MAQGFNMDDIMGSFFGPQSSMPKEEMGVAWHAKEIDGKLYVSLEEVLQLLENNNILPKMQTRLRARTQSSESSK